MFTGVDFPGTVARFAEQSSADVDLLTGRAALAFEVSDAINIYATAGRGAKSGFPRLTLSAALGAASRPYAKSTSWTYETGIKTNLLDGRAHLDLSGFYNDVDDEQLFVLDFVSFQFLPANLDTRSFGVEAQGDVNLGHGWTVAGGAQWTNGTIRQSDAGSGAARGNRIPNVARFSTTATLGFEGQPLSIGKGVMPVFTLSHRAWPLWWCPAAGLSSKYNARWQSMCPGVSLRAQRLGRSTTRLGRRHMPLAAIGSVGR